MRTVLKQIGAIDITTSLDSYSDKMTLSQVVVFFARNNITFTKTMIQNYVRVGILSPPINKRYYTKEHLITLVLTNILKEVSPLDDIKILLNKVDCKISLYDEYITIIKDGKILAKGCNSALEALLLLTQNAINMNIVRNFLH